MKKLRYILLSILAVGIHGCYDLDTYPTDKVASGNFWQDEEDAVEGLMAVYAQLKAQGAFGYQVLFDTYTDLAHGPGSAIEKGQPTGEDEFLVNNWKHSWEGVQRANHVISNVSRMDASTISDHSREQTIGEALFLRSLYYFRLTDLFGDLPIYDESWEVTEHFMNMNQPRRPQQEVFDFIVASLDRAVTALPVSWPQADYGRATKGAAYALRGKMKLWMKDYPGAVADFEEIVYNKNENYGYELYPRMTDLFVTAGPVQGDKETIFAVQNKGGLNNSLGMEFAVIFGNRGTYLGGRGTCRPSVDLADMYEYKDGRPFDWDEVYPGWYDKDPSTGSYPVRESVLYGTLSGANLVQLPDTTALGELYRSRDPRLYQSVIVPWSVYIGCVGTTPVPLLMAIAEGGTAANGYVQQTHGVWNMYYRKFVPVGYMDEMTDRYHTPINLPIIRYADVLLMLAEAYNESGELGKAVVELNKVRARLSTNMPGLNNGDAWLAVGSREEMHRRIMHERAVELHGEGHRFWDIRRWREAGNLLDGKQELTLDGYVYFEREFRDRNYLWPLPTEDIINFPNLLPNNTGW